MAPDPSEDDDTPVPSPTEKVRPVVWGSETNLAGVWEGFGFLDVIIGLGLILFVAIKWVF